MPAHNRLYCSGESKEGRMKRGISLPLVVLLLGLGGCGSVEPGSQPQPALKLLHLFPRDGEINVPRNLQALAVFSHSIFSDSACAADSLQDQVALFQQDCGQSKLNISLDCYRQRDAGGQETARDLSILVLTPAAALEAQTRYCIFFSKGLAGMTQAGSATEPLGADISAYFTTAQ
jgi:hypothetical protein